jgi:hypothetical protein
MSEKISKLSGINLKSEQISVFPSGKRVANSGNRLTEENLVNIVTSISDTSFVDDFDVKSVDNKFIKFVLCGYYIALTHDGVNSLLADSFSGKKVYAKIQFYDGELDGQDAGELYEGVTFDDKEPTDTPYYLQLLDENGNVPKVSTYKYDLSKAYAYNKSEDDDIEVEDCKIFVLDGRHRPKKEENN